MYKSIVREKLIQYLEATKMSKYRFSQKSGMSQSTLYDIRESNILKVSHGMSIEPFELFQTNEQILVLQKMQEIELIQESRLLPVEYQEILFEFLQSLRTIAEKKI